MTSAHNVEVLASLHRILLFEICARRHDYAMLNALPDEVSVPLPYSGHSL